MPLLLAAACGLSVAACGGSDDAAVESAAPLPKVAASAGQAWSETVVRTDEGGFRMGNPDAPMQMLEYASFSCVHCRDFAVASKKELMEMVDSGRLSYEFRSFLLGPQDLPTSLAFACASEAAYFPMMEAWYSDWDNQMQKLQTMDQAKLQQIQAMPKEQQIVAIAEIMGVTDFVAARGVSRDQANACLSDMAAVKQLEESREKATDVVSGTPTVLINGKKVEDTQWPVIRNTLRDAGVR